MKPRKLQIKLPLLLPLLLFANGQQLDVKPCAVRMLDLDGDGQLDKLYLGADGSLRVALHNGARSYLEVVQELPRVDVKDVLVVDLNGDSALDLYLVASENNVVLAGDATGRFRDATLELGLADAGQGLSIERLDLDDDGRPDLLLHNTTHDVVFWARVGGGFERDPEAPIAQLNPNQVPILLPGAPAAPKAAVKETEGLEWESKDGTRRPLVGQPGSARTQFEGTNQARQTVGPQTHAPQAMASPQSIVEGSGSVGRLPKWIGTKQLGDSVLSESAGNLGVGTLSPAAKLDVAGAVAVNGSAVIDAAGQWVGDPTGLVGPAGPVGPMGSPGVVSDNDLNTRGGTETLLSNTSGYGNTAFGVKVLRNNTTGYRNTASGLYALLSNTTGNFNTASGSYALRFNTSGSGNTATGRQALLYNTIGFSNTACGQGALLGNTTGSENTASGNNALRLNNTGASNTATGAEALRFNTTGSENTANGKNALRSNTTGSYNTANGSRALMNNSIGTSNTALGHRALSGNTTGGNNIGIGYYAGFVPTTGNNNIMIGNYGGSFDSGTIRIGSTGQTRAFLAGVRGVTTGVANGLPVLVDSAGQLGTVSSSRRFKEDIQDMGAATDRLLDLRPVLFRYKQEQSMPAGQELVPEYGLIAEEVAEIFPDLVVYDDEGKPFTVKYHILSSMLLNELKKERERNLAIHMELAVRDAELVARDAELAARLSALEQSK